MWTRFANGIRTIRTEHTRLRDLPRPAASAGLEWIGAHVLGSRRRDALRVAPSARVTWTAFAVGGTQVRAWCAAAGGGPREFRIAVECGRRRWQATRRIGAHDGWQPLNLTLPAALTGELAITLDVRADASETAPSLWGDPALVRRRPASAVLRDAFMALRLFGIGGTIRRTITAGRERSEDDRYRAWLADERVAGTTATIGAAHPDAPLISVLTPVYNTEAAWLRRCIESVRHQTHGDWELILSDDGSTDPVTCQLLEAARTDERVRIVRTDQNSGIVPASNRALAAARGTFVAFVDSDDELHPEALEEVFRQITARPDIDVIYTDEDKISPSGVRSHPHFKPDWSPDLLRSCMYVSHLTVMRRTLAVAAGALRPEYEGSQDYDLMLRVSESTDRIAHIPRVLYSWRMAPESGAASPFAKPWAVDAARRAIEDALRRDGRRGRVEQASAMGHFRVRYAIEGTPRVSVLVCGQTDAPDGCDPDAAARAVASRAAEQSLEILIARDPTEPFGARVNRLARAATGDHLLLLDAGVRPIDRDWLEALLEMSQLPGVGAAGPVLLRPDRTIEHAGIVLGLHRFAGCAFRGEPGWTRGHVANALNIRNCSAISAACLLTRRAAFDAAGGLDARLGSGAASIDYGLRLRQAGLRVVLTPYARLRYGGPPILADVTADERQWLRERWGALVDSDPYYNANFDRDAASYRLPVPSVTAASR
jgi:GT2 family glycosyltransferase